MLEPDRDQLEIFVDALFRHAGDKGFVAVRSFYEGADKPFRLSAANLSGGLRFLIDVAEDDARRAAQKTRSLWSSVRRSRSSAIRITHASRIYSRAWRSASNATSIPARRAQP
jgi:hypothetical protein